MCEEEQKGNSKKRCRTEEEDGSESSTKSKFGMEDDSALSTDVQHVPTMAKDGEDMLMKRLARLEAFCDDLVDLLPLADHGGVYSFKLHQLSHEWNAMKGELQKAGLHDKGCWMEMDDVTTLQLQQYYENYYCKDPNARPRTLQITGIPLSHRIIAEDVAQIFAPFGKVEHVRFPTHRAAALSKVVFVRFEEVASASAVKKFIMNGEGQFGFPFEGRIHNLRITWV